MDGLHGSQHFACGECFPRSATRAGGSPVTAIARCRYSVPIRRCYASPFHCFSPLYRLLPRLSFSGISITIAIQNEQQQDATSASCFWASSSPPSTHRCTIRWPDPADYPKLHQSLGGANKRGPSVGLRSQLELTVQVRCPSHQSRL